MGGDMGLIAQCNRHAVNVLGRVGLSTVFLVLSACSPTSPAPTKPTAESKPVTEAKPATESKPVAESKAPQTAAAPANAVLRVAVSTFNEEAFDPTLVSPGAGSGYAGALWDWMTTFTEGEALKPGLATSWSQDGLTWTFNLRQGVKF